MWGEDGNDARLIKLVRYYGLRPSASSNFVLELAPLFIPSFALFPVFGNGNGARRHATRNHPCSKNKKIPSSAPTGPFFVYHVRRYAQ
jgi:hypothetical protein